MLNGPRSEQLDNIDIYDLDIDHIEDYSEIDELDFDGFDDSLDSI